VSTRIAAKARSSHTRAMLLLDAADATVALPPTMAMRIDKMGPRIESPALLSRRYVFIKLMVALFNGLIGR
jgi:hypothetical protein